MTMLGAVAVFLSPALLALGSVVDRGVESVISCTGKTSAAQAGKAKAGKKSKPRIERRYMLM